MLEAFHVQCKSIKSDAFIQLLTSLIAHSKATSFVVFMDNCRVHHSKKVEQFMLEQKFSSIFNIPYGPEFNLIESVLAQFKMGYMKERLEHPARRPTIYEKVIRRILVSFSKEKSLASAARPSSASSDCDILEIYSVFIFKI